MGKLYDDYKKYLTEKYPYLNDLSEKEKEKALADANFALECLTIYKKHRGELPPVEYYPWLGLFIIQDAAKTLGLIEAMRLAVLVGEINPQFPKRIVGWEVQEREYWRSQSMGGVFGDTIHACNQLLRACILRPSTPRSVYWMYQASYLLQRCPDQMKRNIMAELIYPFRNTTGIACPLTEDISWETVKVAFDAVPEASEETDSGDTEEIRSDSSVGQGNHAS